MLNYCLTLLSVFCLNGDIVTVTTPSDCRWLQVEYQQPGGGGGEQQEEKMKIRVPASGNMVSSVYFCFFLLVVISQYSCLICLLQLLRDVKQRAMEELHLHPGNLVQKSSYYVCKCTKFWLLPDFCPPLINCFILIEQIHSSVWDRWTAQRSSFLQVLCHLLPEVAFYKTLKLNLNLHIFTFKWLHVSPPPVIPFFKIPLWSVKVYFPGVLVWPCFSQQCVKSWVFVMQACDSWPHLHSVQEMPLSHHRCAWVFFFMGERFTKFFVLAPAGSNIREPASAR